MTFAQQQNRPTTRFSERISIVKQRVTVLTTQRVADCAEKLKCLPMKQSQTRNFVSHYRAFAQQTYTKTTADR